MKNWCLNEGHIPWVYTHTLGFFAGAKNMGIEVECAKHVPKHCSGPLPHEKIVNYVPKAGTSIAHSTVFFNGQ